MYALSWLVWGGRRHRGGCGVPFRVDCNVVVPLSADQPDPFAVTAGLSNDPFQVQRFRRLVPDEPPLAQPDLHLKIIVDGAACVALEVFEGLVLVGVCQPREGISALFHPWMVWEDVREGSRAFDDLLRGQIEVVCSHHQLNPP